MKKIFLLFSFLLLLHNLLAQDTTYTVSGVIKDTTGEGITGANIWLIEGKDTLRTISNEMGKFTLTNVPGTVFILWINRFGYGTLYKEFVFREEQFRIELPPITLVTGPRILNEVVIRHKRATIIKEDTIEYRANQYHLQENAVVEDLFKRLPGIQVDADGNISSMGKKITKVRINGKDFLLDDIKSLTRLLPVNMIEKVQLIDDYGDMARATGRKSRDPEQIINMQMKGDLHKEYQAQGTAGAGNDGRYSAAVLANYFDEQKQLSITGNTNNISAQVGNGVSSNGNINYRNNFSKKWSVNTGLLRGFTTNNLQSNSTVEVVTSEGILNSTNKSSTNSKNDNYGFTGRLEYKPDAGTIANFNVNVAMNKMADANQIAAIQSEFQRKDQVTDNNVTSRMPVLSSSFFASHRFKGLGRTVSFGVVLNKSDNNNRQDSYDSLRYYNTNNTVVKDSLLHQLLYKINDNLTTNAEVSYIEPLDSISSLELKYGYNSSVIDNRQETQWIDIHGMKQLIDSLSNQNSYTVIQQQIELNYHKNGRLEYLLGASLQPSNLRNSAMTGQRTVIWSNRLVPVFSMQYRFPRSARIALSYRGNVTFPTYQQLQPISDLTNPQFPVIGNPDLRAAFTHSVFSNFRTAGKNTLLMMLSANYTENKVVSNVVLVKDSFNTVKQETHFLNANGDYNVRLGYSWSKRINDGKYNLFMDGNSTYNNNILYMDDVREVAPNLVITQSVKGNMFQDWLELTGGASYTYNRNVYVLVENATTNLNTWIFNLNGKVYFLKTFALTADASKQVNSGYSGAVNVNPLILNATLEKLFLKKKLAVRLQGYNLLNETSLSSQSISGNTVTQNRNNLIGRYFMLSLQYDLRMSKGK